MTAGVMRSFALIRLGSLSPLTSGLAYVPTDGTACTGDEGN
jgi:hypothetical protein